MYILRGQREFGGSIDFSSRDAFINRMLLPEESLLMAYSRILPPFLFCGSNRRNEKFWDIDNSN